MDKVRVLVERGPHAKVPAEVFDYELPILEAIHSHDESPGVTEVSRTEYVPEDGKSFDVVDAYKALELKYNQPDAEAALKNVYPNAAALARAVRESQPKKRAA